MFNIRRKSSERKHRDASGEGRPARISSRGFVMLGLTLGMLLASLDQTVVGTSLPRIVAVLGGMELFSWLFTAYMLAQTITIPIAGKLSDRMGRKPIFMAGMVLFMAGSLIAGFSTSMEMLIVCRFIQGLGGGALIPVAMATVADLYAPQDRGKIQGMLGAVFALSTVIGPFIGGFIVDNWDWDWVFWVNLPIGIFALIVASVKFPALERQETAPVDLLGIVTLVGALAPGLLALTWGGTTYPWTSPLILGMVAFSGIMIAAFIVVERRAADPLLPFGLFRESIFTMGSAGLFIMAVGMFGVIGFLPLFLQAVMGMSATNSGMLTIPLMIGSMVTSITSGFLLKRTGYKPWLLIGPPIMAAGMFLLSTLHAGSSPLEAVIYQAIVGLGMGAVMSNYIVAAQNVMPKSEMGVATSAMSLFRSIGGTVGITLFGAVLNNRMVAEIGANLPAEAAELLPTTSANELGNILLDPELAAIIPAFIQEAIRLSLQNSITYLFLIGAIIVAFSFITSALVRKVPLKSTEEYYGTGAEGHEISEETPGDDAKEARASVTEVPDR
jgi:EmrB/QacA subfamily drug resistance transporter